MSVLKGPVLLDNRAYFHQRIEDELSAAELASDPGIAQIHREMAQRYRDLMSDGDNRTATSLELLAGGAVGEPGTQPA